MLLLFFVVVFMKHDINDYAILFVCPRRLVIDFWFFPPSEGGRFLDC